MPNLSKRKKAARQLYKDVHRNETNGRFIMSSHHQEHEDFTFVDGENIWNVLEDMSEDINSLDNNIDLDYADANIIDSLAVIINETETRWRTTGYNTRVG
jgi:hypothetical protein